MTDDDTRPVHDDPCTTTRARRHAHDDPCTTIPAHRTEVEELPRTPHPRVLNPRRRVLLHSRPHIDLQRVAGALCCS
ncbi:hypothetical protein ADK57_28270 [Streptomyces sp. MMG1533]|uniref:putative leader peptide n=1 Tax=Streptomyces sp. MMG1533 TaxID=1415546 RepID=UPI0006ADCEED|nr:hypothetical protein ADK57_28270 [Streptomyces sp. MMG1533]